MADPFQILADFKPERPPTPPARPSLPQRILQTEVPGLDLSIGDVAEQLLRGTAEPARTASAIVGGFGQSLGRGATAIGAGVLSMLRGEQTTVPSVRRAVGRFQKTTDPFVARPETSVGRATVEAAALPFTAGTKALEFLGLTEEAAQGAGDILGLRLAGPQVAKVAAKTARASFRELRDLGERGSIEINNKAMDAAREAEGMPPATNVERTQFPKELAEAVARENKTPGAGRSLAERLSKEPEALTTAQVMDLLVEEGRVRQQLREAKDALNEAKGEVELAEAKANVAGLEEAFQQVGDAAKGGGRLQAQAFVARQTLMAKDFTVETMVRDSRTAKGGKLLTPEETAGVETRSKNIEKLEENVAVENKKAAAKRTEAEKPIREIFEEPEGKEKAIFALKLKTGEIITDKSAVTHADVAINKGILPNDVVDVGVIDSSSGKFINRVEIAAKAKDPFEAKVKGERPPAKPRTREQLIAAGEASLAKTIADLESRIARGDISLRSRQKGPESPLMKAQRAHLKELNKEMQILRNLKKDKRSPEEVRMQRLITRMKNQTARLQEKRLKGELETVPAEPVRLSPEGIEVKRLLDKEKDLFAEDLFNLRRSQRGGLEIGKDILIEGLSLSRALVTSGEMSAVFRQAGPLTLGSPTLFWRMLKPYFEAMRSESRQAAVEHNIRNSPNALNGNYARMKLDLTEKSQGLRGREETQQSRIADKIPLVAATQRGFTTSLNWIRTTSADIAIAALEKDGGGALSKADFLALGEAINTATGRGSIGVLARPFVTLNGLFFAPRLVFSRMKLALGVPIWQAYYKGSPRAAKIIARQYAKTLMGIATLSGIAIMAGAEIETDFRSSDLGKWRFGKTRVDPWMGIAQISVFTAKELSGQAKSLSTGRVRNLTGEDAAAFGGTNRFDTAVTFLRTKFSPGIGAGINLFTGENVVGQQSFVETELVGLVIPMAYRDVYDVMRDQGVPHLAALTILINFGMGTMTFDPKKKIRYTTDNMPTRLRKRFEAFKADAIKMMAFESRSPSIRGKLGAVSVDPFAQKAAEEER